MANRNDADGKMSGSELQASQSGGEPQQSRGERFDEMQGGGRAADSVSDLDGGGEEQRNAAGDQFLRDRQSDQKRAQGNMEGEEESS